MNYLRSPSFISSGRVKAKIRIYLKITASIDAATELKSLEQDIQDGLLGDVRVTPGSYKKKYNRELKSYLRKIHVYMNTTIYLWIHTHTHTRARAHARTHALTHARTYVRTYIHTYIHTCMHACMHAYTVICLVVCGDLPLFKSVFQVPTA